MNASAYALYALDALFGLAALVFLFWAVKRGFVSGDEAPKYRMLEDDVLPHANGGEHGGKDGDR